MLHRSKHACSNKLVSEELQVCVARDDSNHRRGIVDGAAFVCF